jgi:L-fuconolactonase
MIDAHVHCWDTTVFNYRWLDVFPSLPKQRLLEDYATAATRAVSSVIVVEAGAGPEGAAEALWLAERGQRGSTPTVAGVVASLPVERGSDIVAELENLLEAVPLACGIRRDLEAMPPRTSCDMSFRAGVAAVGRRGLPFDLCASGPTLEDAVELATALPEVRFVLDHVGKPPRRTEHGVRATWHSAVDKLARLDNVSCKLSGLLTRGDGTRPEDSDAFDALRHGLDAFGPQRSMVGSDWPVITVSASCDEWFSLVDGVIADLSPDERRWIEHRTAANVYRLGGVDD